MRGDRLNGIVTPDGPVAPTVSSRVTLRTDSPITARSAGPSRARWTAPPPTYTPFAEPASTISTTSDTTIRACSFDTRKSLSRSVAPDPRPTVLTPAGMSTWRPASGPARTSIRAAARRRPSFDSAGPRAMTDPARRPASARPEPRSSACHGPPSGGVRRRVWSTVGGQLAAARGLCARERVGDITDGRPDVGRDDDVARLTARPAQGQPRPHARSIRRVPSRSRVCTGHSAPSMSGGAVVGGWFRRDDPGGPRCDHNRPVELVVGHDPSHQADVGEEVRGLLCLTLARLDQHVAAGSQPPRRHLRHAPVEVEPVDAAVERPLRLVQARLGGHQPDLLDGDVRRVR